MDGWILIAAAVNLLAWGCAGGLPVRARSAAALSPSLPPSLAVAAVSLARGTSAAAARGCVDTSAPHVAAGALLASCCGCCAFSECSHAPAASAVPGTLAGLLWASLRSWAPRLCPEWVHSARLLSLQPCARSARRRLQRGAPQRWLLCRMGFWRRQSLPRAHSGAFALSAAPFTGALRGALPSASRRDRPR